MTWTGYKVHLTETCEANALHVITHVETTEAAVSDVDMTEPIHQALAAHQLLPDEHVVDAGYVDAELIVQSRQDFNIELMGPVRPDVSWQAQHEQAYDISQFTIDWKGKCATCPQGKQSSSWTPYLDPWENEVIRVKWRHKDCGPCDHRSWCTTAKTAPRHMTIRPEPQHMALQRTRQQQTTPEWKSRYDVRAGIEGTLSQGLRCFGLRQCRYIGLAKTRLQHVATAAAMNIDRLAAWLDGRPHAKARTSRFAALAS